MVASKKAVEVAEKEVVATTEVYNKATEEAAVANTANIAALNTWGATLTLNNAQQAAANALTTMGVEAGIANAAVIGGLTTEKQAEITA
jgi:uncharacterized membrane protein YccF (DUF307 family)